jgi:hypothetical protein
MTSKHLLTPLALLTILSLSAAACDSQSDAVSGPNGEFDVLTLVSSGGMPWPPHDGDECNASYANTTTVQAATATIVWDTCRYDATAGHNVIARGSRTLGADELQSVRQAVAVVHVGNNGMCGADKATVTLDILVGDKLGRYVDDFYGCDPPIDGRTFVQDTTNLEYLMWNLVPKPAITA